ncbi:MAG TPA: ATP-binding protein [Candidatus Bathyarchaeota archaeon]|nr:ATP-binding protein [Candidatus Bathyarchaeota archaeon]
MGLYDEAIRFKRLAESAIKKGDLESARRYLMVAIDKLEKLERISEDPTLREMWRRGIQNLRMLLESIESGAIAKAKHEIRRYEPTIHKPEKLGVRKGEKRVMEIPEECRTDFLYTSIPDVTFDDVAGLEVVKKELKESIEWQLKYPDLLKKMGLRPIKGLLLYGPPGTGKTFVVKAAAGQFKIPLIIVDPATLLSKWLGESEKMVAKIFGCARKVNPCIVFIDETDKVFPIEVAGSDAPKRIEAQLLQELDGIKSGEGFIVIFASNEPWKINPALIRAGRIDKVIYVGPPDKKMRRKLFELYLRGVELADDVDLDKLVDMTEPNQEGYYSAAAIALICNEAKKNLLRDYEKTGTLRKLTMSDLVSAVEKTRRDIPASIIGRHEDWGREHFVGG